MITIKEIKTFISNNLPASIVKLLSKIFGKNFYQFSQAGQRPYTSIYSTLTLTDEDIKQGVYKQYLGGGDEKWELRGTFQLFFLQQMGMSERAKVLDIGCGPGRASKYLIGFLDRGNYYGVDYNADFIRVAELMAQQHQLIEKSPAFKVVENFNFEQFAPIFDYAIVFSVLNHCNGQQKKAFFSMISQPLKPGGKVYISHAFWFNDAYLENSNMKLTNQFGTDDFDITQYGWEDKNEIFPIIELTRC
jgi:SAM-dependent methyltransferase